MDAYNIYLESKIEKLEQQIHTLNFRVEMLETQRNLDYVIDLLEKNIKTYDELGEIGKEFDEILAQSLTEPQEKR